MNVLLQKPHFIALHIKVFTPNTIQPVLNNQSQLILKAGDRSLIGLTAYTSWIVPEFEAWKHQYRGR